MTWCSTHPYRIMACVRRSNDWQELVDQLEASVAAPSATPQTLLDAVAWNNTIHDDPCAISCMSFWGERSVALMLEVSAVRGDLTNRLLLKLLSVCNQCFFSEHFFPWQKTRQLWCGWGAFSQVLSGQRIEVRVLVPMRKNWQAPRGSRSSWRRGVSLMTF